MRCPTTWKMDPSFRPRVQTKSDPARWKSKWRKRVVTTCRWLEEAFARPKHLLISNDNLNKNINTDLSSEPPHTATITIIDEKNGAQGTSYSHMGGLT